MSRVTTFVNVHLEVSRKLLLHVELFQLNRAFRKRIVFKFLRFVRTYLMLFITPQFFLSSNCNLHLCVLIFVKLLVVT